MPASELVDQLNQAQHQAVTADPGNQLILAGAGSGKTRVLVHRIAWLVQTQGVSPYSILAVTFTNKAAREMRGRLDELFRDAGTPINTRSMWVGTFHGLAHRLLKAHWKDAKLPQNFQILDSDDQLRLIKRVYQNLGLDAERWPPRQAQWFINGQKDEGLRAKHIQESADPFVRTMAAVYRAYEADCERGGLVDFAELLLRAHELWLNNPSLLSHYQGRFPFILVDEFQDTNSVQYAWLRVLAGEACFVTAVGDDDQSIYGWRGAKIENIRRFEDEYPQTQVIRLEQNYRSTGHILNAANAVIANNQGRLGKTLWTEGEDGDPISLYAAFNEQDEARFIVERINDWTAKGNSKNSCAILYRSNAQSRVLEEALLREGIPYRIYGGQRFYDRLEIKNALAYMRLAASHNDDPAFERVINTPTRGIGAKTLDDIRAFALEHGCSLWQASEQILHNKMLSARAANALQGFISLVETLTDKSDDLTLDQLAQSVLDTTGLYEFHKKEKGEKGQARAENLEELVTACAAFDAEDEDESDLQQFLDTAALDAGEAQADEFEDAVQLMTLHSAKGLEFPLVFMAGAEENLFPHKMSIEDPDRLEEERRLAYVGITRAMQKLYICYAETRRLYGGETFNSVSRFVKEIPNEHLDEVRIKSTISRPARLQPQGSRNPSRGAKAGLRLSDSGSDTGFKLGQRVEHKKFGEGTIIHFEGSGPSTRVQINFDTEGTKWLVMQYAKLEAV
ncbi:DNA helicase II [Gilvimarinus agarilyticus]|uniref:DNA helicase II n=1 Tax=unclassified Gilvimarinus TaxID=2642066 RepID=UPI001C08D803|nr:MULTISPECIES: DNA helicase II [unclassified Gilvimarinus]MBU2886324.1 DNA helicase II [Gilvimarinus agarilyticus]MDO6571010.1 DNA helicase II [Gilvimarinus sp. 2_MG-2023]MDO6747970.1 DNA helicase II [Gilvimarinus sp. 1_MG-2023]